MAKKIAKTNAVRLLEQQKVAYELFEYETDGGQAVDGITDISPNPSASTWASPPLNTALPFPQNN